MVYRASSFYFVHKSKLLTWSVCVDLHHPMKTQQTRLKSLSSRLVWAVLISWMFSACAAVSSPSDRLPVAAPLTTPTATITAASSPTSQPTDTPTIIITSTPTQTPPAGVASTPTQSPTVWPTASATPPSSPLPTESSTTSGGCPCGIKHVVIISIDGLRPDAIEQTDTPTLDTLRARGAYQPAAQAVLPSVTLVNHASMLSGLSPAKHGIYWNSNEPDLGKIKGPTLFSVAHEAGLSSVMVVGKPKLEQLVLPNSVDDFIYAGFTDRQVVNKAVEVIRERMPDLLFIHLPDVDSAGHSVGWMSPGQLLTLSLTDRLLGEVVAALEAQGYLADTLLIVTADHGGSGFKHGSDSSEDMTIPWLAVGPGVPTGVTLASPIVTYDTAATALYALHIPLPPEWDGRPAKEIFEQK